jgi:membrane protein DedA with SNARE-associated domain
VSASPHLPGVLAALGPLIKNNGYLAVGGLVLLEDFGIPVPGETVLIVAAVYAGAGQLNIVAVAALAFVAAVIGDNIGFAIGHFGGRPLALRLGRYVFLTPARLDKAQAFFTRHGGKVVTIARFLEGLRQANGIIAGITGMHWAKFLAFNALGAALWVGTWSAIGYAAGNHIGTIYTQVTRYSLYVLIAVGVIIVAQIARHLLRRRRERGSAADEDAADPDRTATADEQPSDNPPAAGDQSHAGEQHPDTRPAPPPAGEQPPASQRPPR